MFIEIDKSLYKTEYEGIVFVWFKLLIMDYELQYKLSMISLKEIIYCARWTGAWLIGLFRSTQTGCKISAEQIDWSVA